MPTLIPRDEALNLLGEKPDSRLRNYEIEHELHERDKDNEYVVAEWCPFNGIRCAFWEYADETWLEPALESHKIEVAVGRMAPFVVDEIQARLNEVRARKEKTNGNR